MTTKTEPIFHASPLRMTGPGQTSPAALNMIQEWTSRSLGPAPPSQVTVPRDSSILDVLLTAPLERYNSQASIMRQSYITARCAAGYQLSVYSGRDLGALPHL